MIAPLTVIIFYQDIRACKCLLALSAATLGSPIPSAMIVDNCAATVSHRVEYVPPLTTVSQSPLFFSLLCHLVLLSLNSEKISNYIKKIRF